MYLVPSEHPFLIVIKYNFLVKCISFPCIRRTLNKRPAMCLQTRILCNFNLNILLFIVLYNVVIIHYHLYYMYTDCAHKHKHTGPNTPGEVLWNNNV